MNKTTRPASQAIEGMREYEFTPIDQHKPVYYGFVKSAKEADDHAEAAKVGMYRRIK